MSFLMERTVWKSSYCTRGIQ